jgi:hypothetical protein
MNAKRLLFVFVLLSLILAACGGGGGGDGSPVDAVKNVVEAIEKLDVEEARKYVCSQHQADLPDLEESFAELEEMGIDMDEFLDAFNIKMSDMKYEEKSKDGDKAVVHVSGKMSFDVDVEKLKPILKKALEQMLGEMTDEMLDSVMEEFTAEMDMGEQSFEGDVDLVKEDGKWLVCDDLDFLDEMGTGM